jgi:hypothetical protein
MFSSTSHVHITGGNFIDVGGDFNLQTIQPQRSVDDVLTGLEFHVGQDQPQHLLGERRNDSKGGQGMFPCAFEDPLELYFLLISRRLPSGPGSPADGCREN